MPKDQNTPAHRPLGVYHALEQLYEEDLEARSQMSEEMEKTLPDGQNDNQLNFSSFDDLNKPSSSALNVTLKANEGKLLEKVLKPQQNSINNDAKATKKDSRLAKIFRRKNLTNLLHRFIF